MRRRSSRQRSGKDPGRDQSFLAVVTGICHFRWGKCPGQSFLTAGDWSGKMLTAQIYLVYIETDFVCGQAAATKVSAHFSVLLANILPACSAPRHSSFIAGLKALPQGCSWHVCTPFGFCRWYHVCTWWQHCELKLSLPRASTVHQTPSSRMSIAAHNSYSAKFQQLGKAFYWLFQKAL